MKSKSYTGIIYLAALLIAFLLLFSGCATTKYKVRNKNNHLIQEMQQHQNRLNAGKDWTRPYRNWYRRPHSHWPLNFLQ